MGIPGKEIYRTYDEYGMIQVYDDGERRYLSFGEDFEQSCTLKSNPFLLQHDYAKAMLLPFLFIEPQHITLLGFGGGSLATCLMKRFPELTMDAVELRDAVIKTAFKYFQVPKTERLSVKNMDASEVFDDASLARPDILFSDLFTVDGLDLQQMEPVFLEQCYQYLSDDGWLVLNCWSQHRGNKTMLNVLHKYFSEVREVSTDCGNWVLLASKRENKLSEKELKVRAKAFSQTIGYSILPQFSHMKILKREKNRVA